MRRWTRRRLFFVLTPMLVFGPLTLKLFEPGFVYISGWTQVPDGPYPTLFSTPPA